MQWTRAVHHLQTLAETCAEMAGRPTTLFPLQVTHLWATGEVLDGPRELEVVEVALGVDLPPSELAWATEPTGAQHWANATRLSRLPLRPWWRSTQGPVWNHHVVRPLLLWSVTDGVQTESLAALVDGTAELLRPAPPSKEDLRTRFIDEADVSRQALTDCLAAYDARRWAPGKLEPASDALAAAARGHLDVVAVLAAG